jgi:Protein of unknown function (DUF3105)
MRRVLGVVVAVVAVGSLAACASDGTTATAGGGTTPTSFPGEPEGTKTYTGLARTHVDTKVDYPQTPPVGGPHNPVWQTCQFYDQPIHDETGVHSMEHGAVWITYSPDLPADQVDTLQALEPSKRFLLISPHAGLPANVVATAWGKQLYLDSVDDPRLAQFIATFEHGPQTPEEGVSCQGGTVELATG